MSGKKKFPEFSEALKKGKEIVDFEVESALLQSAKNGNVTAQIYWLNNRKPDKWRNKRTEEAQEQEGGVLVLPEVGKQEDTGAEPRP